MHGYLSNKVTIFQTVYKKLLSTGGSNYPFSMEKKGFWSLDLEQGYKALSLHVSQRSCILQEDTVNSSASLPASKVSSKASRG